jgi:tRNA dimethylallyltransferase
VEESEEKYNCVVLLGPTAVGKTAVGVMIADHYQWPIISADSRQVYKGLDIGSGKDIKDYFITKKNNDGTERTVEIEHYLIDNTTLETEYNVFNYQQDFYKLFTKLQPAMPLVVGGTGMYLDAVIRGYDFVPVPENKELRQELKSKSLDELAAMLIQLKPNLHNKSDLLIRERVIRALEIALFNKSVECDKLRRTLTPRPEIHTFVIGTTIPREMLHANISRRLEERLNEGMVDEVKTIHEQGASWDRLERLGLEYRYVSQFLEGKIQSREELFTVLNHEISQFAKRQETWFRGMEKKGVVIHWLPPVADKEARYQAALSLIEDSVLN